MSESHQEFGKYDDQGAYHWRQMRPSLRRYNAGLAARYDRALSLVRGYCDPNSITSILDIGCGDGYFTTQLATLFPTAKVNGYDFSETGIKFAREMCKAANVSFQVGDAFNGDNERVSLVCATDVIEHVDDYRVFLGRCRAALAEHGKLLISTPIRYKEKPDDPYHIHEFFIDELAQVVMHAGFKLLVHTNSHDYRVIENYGKRYSFFGMGRMRLGKYKANFEAIVLKKNPFFVGNVGLPTMQYLVAEKT